MSSNVRQAGLGGIVKAGVWMYWSTILNNVSGLVYWLLITKIAGPEVLGLTSATIGLGAILASIVNLGMQKGIQRFLGREWVRNRDEFNKYFWSTLYLRFLLYGIVAGLLWLLGEAGLSIANYTSEMFKVTAILVLVAPLQLFVAYYMSILRTDLMFVSYLLGNIAKVVVGVVLVNAGYGFTGAVIGYVFVNLFTGAVGVTYALRHFGITFSIDLKKVKEVIEAGLASWIPELVTMLGMWIGVVAVFGASGSVSTGHYYVAFMVFSIVWMIGGSVSQLLLPYLSGVEGKRGEIASRITSFVLVVTVPAAFAVMVHGDILLGLLGQEYITAFDVLVILLVSAIPLLIVMTVTNLVYAIGDYREVLFIGLAQNVPRLLLYLALVPVYHGVGAAIAFTVGSLVSLPYALWVGRRYGFRLDYAKTLTLVGIPLALATVDWLVGFHWIAGSLLVSSSYLVYGRMGLITRSDVRLLASSFLSEEKMMEYYNRFRFIIDKILPL